MQIGSRSDRYEWDLTDIYTKNPSKTTFYDILITTRRAVVTTRRAVVTTRRVAIAARFLVKIPNVGMLYSQRGNTLFPAWECFIPSVGISAQKPIKLPVKVHFC